MKASINLSSGYFSKNKKTLQELYDAYDDNDVNQIGTYFMEIGELEKVFNLNDFEKAYWGNDTAQEHPVYYKVYDNLNKFDLKGVKLSPLAMEPSSNYQVTGSLITEGEIFNIGRGIKDNGEYSNTTTRDTDTIKELFPDYYGQRLCYRYMSNRYRPALLDTIDTCVGQIKPLQSTFEKYFTNSNVVGLKAYYNTLLDKVLAPAIITPTSSSVQDPVNNNRMVAYSSDYTTPLMYFDTETGYYDTPEQGPDGYYRYDICKHGLFLNMSFMNKSNSWTNTFPCFSFVLKGNDLQFFFSTRSASIRTPPIFLRDKNGDYWMMMLTPIETYSTYESESKIGDGVSYTPVISLINIKDFPKLTRNGNGNLSSTNISEYVITALDNDIDYLRQLLDKVFNPQSGPYYDDGGADIVGPGDPYGDISNVGEIIGGNSDLTETIQTDNASPNTSYTSFGTSTGYFGSYSLTNNDLKNYTDTLRLLYEKSTTPIIGVATSTIADRMNNAITGMIMIPKVIPENYKKNRVFALGNCGVKNPNASWTTYALGLDGAYANADLIMNSIIEWTVQLNPIYHYYDNYLDFAPYSTASLYIPYIGTQVLPINIIQSTKDKIVDLKLSFRLNCMNGDLICILMVDGVPMTHWNGNCARNIKVSVNDDSQAIREGVNGILSMVSMNLGNNGMYSTSMSAGQVNNGNANIIDSHTRSSTSSGSLSISGVPSVPSAITSSQHLIGSSCSTGELGWIDSQNIYLTIERPQWWRPNDYGDLIGYPTKKIARLGSIKGFAKVIQCHVRCSGTTSEKEELMGKLAEGVIF